MFKVTPQLFCRLYVCRLSIPLRPNLRGPGLGVLFRKPTPLPKLRLLIIIITSNIIIFYSNTIVIILNINFIDIHEISYNKAQHCMLYGYLIRNKCSA